MAQEYITPINIAIKRTKKVISDAWWDGEDQKAMAHERLLKHYQELSERGDKYVINF